MDGLDVFLTGSSVFSDPFSAGAAPLSHWERLLPCAQHRTVRCGSLAHFPV